MAGKTTRRTSNEFEFKNSVIFADTNTVVTSTNLTTNDPVIAVNSGNTAVPTGGSGLEVTTSGTNPSIIYTPANSGKWSLTEAANIDFSGANLLNFSVSNLTNLTVTNFISNNVDIGGGAIDGTPIGATAAATGTFTDLTATGTVDLGTFSGNEFTGNVTGNVHAQDTSVMVNSNTKTFTGDLTGAVTGDVTGDVKATNATIVLQNGTNGTDASFRGNILSSDGLSTVLNVSTATPVLTGNVTGRVSTLDNHSTATLQEDPSATVSSGTMYYTDARVDTRINSTSINALSDVNTSGITNDQVLIWNTSNSRFQPGALGHSVSNLQTDNDTATAAVTGATLNANPASGLTVSITPGSATNRITIRSLIRYTTSSTSSTNIFVQLWRDKGTGSELLLAERKITENSSSASQRQTNFNLFDTPGTGAHTYAIYYDADNNDGTLTPNPAYSTGGTSQNYIVAEELLVQSDILTEMVQDTSPQLGGTLDANNFGINMGSGSVTVTGLPNPSNATDAANKQWVEAQVATANELSELTDVDLTGVTTGSILKYGGAGWIVSQGFEELTEVVEDTSPQLGGALDLNSQNITGTGSINITGNADFTGNVTLGGNLTVNGTTTTIDVTTLEVDDPLIYLNRNASDNANNTTDSGILVERGSSEDHAGMIWDESADEFRFFTSPSITAATTVVSGMVSADIRAATAHVTATQAQYADLAELYTADADYEPGTVMIFGGDAEVTQSMKSMDHRIAGVVSTDPAYLMNKDQKGKTVAVALRGKVPVSVIGPVKKGDLIVTSDEPGVGQAHAGVTNCVYVIGRCIEDDDTENLVRLINCVV